MSEQLQLPDLPAAPAAPEASVAAEDPFFPGRVVKHTYDQGDAEVVRYGLVVEREPLLIAWLPAEPAAHLVDAIQGA